MENTAEIISEYLDNVSKTRSPKTHKTYAQALKAFTRIVGEDPLDTKTYIKFLKKIANMNPSTQALYRSAVMGLYLFASTNGIEVNAAALTQAKRQYSRRQGQRLPNFDREAVERVLSYCQTLQSDLMALRDRAFVLTLADTGLRISEACALRRGDIDWNEGRSLMIGKGDKQDVVRFSDRSMKALKEYLAARATLDGESGKPLTSLRKYPASLGVPLFARHDDGAGGKIRPVRSGGMWAAIKQRMKELKERMRESKEDVSHDPTQVRIHDFRHYFVTVFYAGSGNLLATKDAARHASSETTSRYAHVANDLVDRIYDQVINRRQSEATADVS
jgi:integrase/recombinase XerC